MLFSFLVPFITFITFVVPIVIAFIRSRLGANVLPQEDPFILLSLVVDWSHVPLIPHVLDMAIINHNLAGPEVDFVADAGKVPFILCKDVLKRRFQFICSKSS